MTPKTFAYICELVLTRSAIVLDVGKEYLVDSRLTPLARSLGFDSLEEFGATLSRTPFDSMHRQAVEAMTTNETSFCRDIHPFEAMRNVIIPNIMKRKEASRRLNIWCAAASTGQEPYTVAMLLREHFPVLRDWQIYFLATDLSNAVLAKARKGSYSQLEVNRGLSATLLVKYFTREGSEWRLKEDVRSMIEFRELNLIERWPAMPTMDLVLMRNVLIYFDVATKKSILQGIRNVMSPQGYLMLGGAESTMGLDNEFSRVAVDKGVAYRLAADVQEGKTYDAA